MGLKERFLNWVKGSRKSGLALSLSLRITLIVTALIVTVSVISGSVIFNLSIQALNNESRDELKFLASTAAMYLDPQKLKKIQSPSDENSKEYTDVQKQLQRIQNISYSKVRYIYTIRTQGSSYVYGVDAVPTSDVKNHSTAGSPFVTEDYTSAAKGFIVPSIEPNPTTDPVYGGITQTGYAPILDAAGKTVGVLAVDMDISDVKAEEVSLRVAQTIILLFSVTAALIFASMASKYLSAPIEVLTRGTEEIAEGNLDIQLPVYRKDELGHLATSFNHMADKLKKANEDVKAYSAQMLHQEKMAAVGQLSAGVAHEINNPLGFIQSNTDVISDYLRKYRELYELEQQQIQNSGSWTEQDFRDHAERVLAVIKKNRLDFISEDVDSVLEETGEGIRRIGKIVKSLLGFSRKDSIDEYEPFDLNMGIENTLVVANNEIKYIAKVETDLGKIPDVYAVRGEINQIVLNLILNAAYAMAEKGGLGLIRIRTFEEGDKVCCSIGDNGTGIPEAIRSKIFEPFFTTKPLGIGTGLGLSVAYDTLTNKYKGFIRVESVLGEGTTFTFGIPKVKAVIPVEE